MTYPSLNYPLLSIPAYYVFSIIPHVYAGSIVSASGYHFDNANPRASLSPDAVKGKVPDAVFQKYQRAQNAHSNNMEQLPLYAAAVLASIIAEKTTGQGLGDATGLTTFIGAFMAIRTAYVISYIQIAEHSKSVIRSAFWVMGAALSFYQIYKAALLLG